MNRAALVLRTLALTVLLCGILPLANAQEVEYKTPSQEAMEMILATPLSRITFNPAMDMGAVYGKDEPYAGIAEIAAINEFKVAGLRLNADNFSQTRRGYYTKLELIKVPAGTLTAIEGLPANPRIHDFKWSPDGRTLCFLNDTPNEVELYKVDVTAPAPAAVKINARPVNTIYGSSFAFLDNQRIIYRSVPADLGAFPKAELPKGPIVMESFGKKSTYRTYQDLLKSPYDEAVYEYLCTAVLAIYDGSATRTVGEKGIIRSFTPSPDGNYLIVNTLHRPYSYSSSSMSFPSKTQLWDVEGNVVRVLKDLPPTPPKNLDRPLGKKPHMDKDKNLRKERKPSKNGFAWRTDMDAVLTWIETAPSPDGKEEDLDRGPGRFRPDEEKPEDKDKPERTWFTSLYQCAAPFDLDQDKQLVFTSEYRLGRVFWGNATTALYSDRSTKQKLMRTFYINPSDTTVRRLLITEDTSLDTLGGRPVIGEICLDRATGRLKLDRKSSCILLSGDNRPDENGDYMSFIDRITLKDGKLENVWMGKAPYKTLIAGIPEFDARSVRFIATKESPTDVPNYITVNVKKKKVKEIPFTGFVNNIPHYDRIRSEYLTYQREDGVHCTARVFLPADYDKERDGRLPVFMWTYPYEHKSVAQAESRRRADRYGFAVPGRNKQIFWCLNGFAVVLEWSMPIISEKNGAEPNEMFRKNLVMNAEAIIKALDEAGIGDPKRMSVGGHSYGGFMTGNLLAHTRLYKLGIANSGAYNRSLTPYGFQSEDRDYWKITEIYNAMSPFNYATQVKDAILLTHGQMDENTGTHPIQSERFYYAIAGHNGNARWLQLPYEGHGYAYKENLLHYFYTVESMLDKFVKNAKVED